jgi:hypothetical protein
MSIMNSNDKKADGLYRWCSRAPNSPPWGKRDTLYVRPNLTPSPR